VVELEDPATGEHLSVQVVSPAEASVLETPMKISDASPMGKALLGHRVGDVLSLDTPRGRKEFRVVAVHG
jgi:transcription elongation factor GreA